MSERVAGIAQQRREKAENPVWRRLNDFANVAGALGRGDTFSGYRYIAKLQRELGRNDVVPAFMTKRRRDNGRRGRRRRGRGRRRSMPASLRPLRLPVKRIVPYSATSGSEHRWYYVVPLSLLTASFTATFQEFKVLSMTVRYVPNNSLSETGLYVAVMLDREGFGSYGAATAVQWFSYLGSMPGSVIKPRHVPSIHRWKPTEPSARDWFNKDQVSSVHLATIYICNNGLETEELGGLLEIRASLLARGRYWNAAVSHAQASITLEPFDLEPVRLVSSDPDYQPTSPIAEPSAISRTTSHSSLVGAFVAL